MKGEIPGSSQPAIAEGHQRLLRTVFQPLPPTSVAHAIVGLQLTQGDLPLLRIIPRRELRPMAEALTRDTGVKLGSHYQPWENLAELFAADATPLLENLPPAGIDALKTALTTIWQLVEPTKENPQSLREIIAVRMESLGREIPEDLLDRVGNRSIDDLFIVEEAYYPAEILDRKRDRTTIGPILDMTDKDLLEIGLDRNSIARFKASLFSYVEIVQTKDLEPRGIPVYLLSQLEIPETLLDAIAPQPIEVLNPSTRLRNSLSRVPDWKHITTIGELLQMTELELVENLRGPWVRFGPIQLAELKSKLDLYINQSK